MRTPQPLVVPTKRALAYRVEALGDGRRGARERTGLNHALLQALLQAAQ